MRNLGALTALPPYLGSKRRLAPLIFALLAEELPRSAWSDARLSDPFCGGGDVSLYAKAQGFHVIASDHAARSAIVAQALIANSTVRLRPEDIAQLAGASAPEGAAQAFVPKVFTPAQAEWVDGAATHIEEKPEPLRSLLTLVLIKQVLRFQPMSLLSATDVAAAASGDFDRVSSRRLGHYLRQARRPSTTTLQRIARDINGGVFGGSGEAHREDALELIPRTDAEVIYLDPPYPGTTGYDDAYSPLDAILGESHLLSKPPALTELLEASGHIPLWVLSYGGPTLTLEQLVATVSRFRPVCRALAVPYAHLRSIASEVKNANNQELIVIAGR